LFCYLDAYDPDKRCAYLDFACAGKPALRERVETLLRSHQQADAFLDVPAIEQLARDDQALTFLAPSTDPGSLGRLDHYEVLEVVGRGSTAAVLKGRDTKSQRVVAIKVLNPLLAANRTARRLFIREAQAAAAVRDDHVIAIYAVSDEGLVPYLVMEYIAGVTLAGRIERNGALELKEVLRIGMQMAKGLAAAHAQGLVHRDIKPGNILLENGVQRVKITDFGLAYADKGVIIGTPMFMSPEQARGEPFDHRTDLFSLGSVLYTLCTGQAPFQADNTVAALRRVCEDTPRPIREVNPSIPVWLCDIIAKLHAKDMNERFASAQKVADLLGRHLELLQRPFPAPRAAAPSNPALLSKVEPRARFGSPFPRRYLVIVASLAALLVLLGLLALYLVSRQYRRPADKTGREGSQPSKHVLSRSVTKSRVIPTNGRRRPLAAIFKKGTCHGYRCR
jgi:serine/threonine protein kinase